MCPDVGAKNQTDRQIRVKGNRILWLLGKRRKNFIEHKDFSISGKDWCKINKLMHWDQ